MARIRRDVTDARKPRRRFEFFLRRILKMYTLGACVAGKEKGNAQRAHVPSVAVVRAVRAQRVARLLAAASRRSTRSMAGQPQHCYSTDSQF